MLSHNRVDASPNLRFSGYTPQVKHNGMVNVRDSELAQSVALRLATDFEREIFRAALLSFDQLDNSLRVNNFATALRELGRIHLESEAPADRVRRCIWFEQKKNQYGQPIIQRA